VLEMNALFNSVIDNHAHRLHQVHAHNLVRYLVRYFSDMSYQNKCSVPSLSHSQVLSSQNRRGGIVYRVSVPSKCRLNAILSIATMLGHTCSYDTHNLRLCVFQLVIALRMVSSGIIDSASVRSCQSSTTAIEDHRWETCL
jgi:hypothetical protein